MVKTVITIEGEILAEAVSPQRAAAVVRKVRTDLNVGTEVFVVNGGREVAEAAMVKARARQATMRDYWNR